MIQEILGNRVALFMIRVCLIFGALYCLNYCIIGLTVSGGYYSSFVSNQLDYISAYRRLLLQGASILSRLFGFENHIDNYNLYLHGVSTVKMIYSCIGFNMLFFWVAITLSYPQGIKRKISYLMSGIIGLTILNMLRVGCLAMVRSVKCLKHYNIDHHLIFTLFLYLLIFKMMAMMMRVDGSNDKIISSQPIPDEHGR
jgi:exosortase/archaeosortase family protein